MDAKELQALSEWFLITKREADLYGSHIPMFSIVLVGCGGTGSLLVPGLMRLSLEAGSVREKWGNGPRGMTAPVGWRADKNEIEILLIDSDVVEEKNLLRQNFCQGDVGKYKAQALAERYGKAFGREVASEISRFKEGYILEESRAFTQGVITLIISCTDSHRSRVSIERHLNGRRFPSNYIWVDAGNEKDNGQVFISGTFGRRVREIPKNITQTVYRDNHGPFFWERIGTNLITAHPRIKDIAEKEPEFESCADRVESGEQSFVVNQTAANVILNIVSTLVRREPLNYYEVMFDTDCNVQKRYVSQYPSFALQAGEERKKILATKEKV